MYNPEVAKHSEQIRSANYKKNLFVILRMKANITSMKRMCEMAGGTHKEQIYLVLGQVISELPHKAVHIDVSHSFIVKIDKNQVTLHLIWKAVADNTGFRGDWPYGGKQKHHKRAERPTGASAISMCNAAFDIQHTSRREN